MIDGKYLNSSSCTFSSQRKKIQESFDKIFDFNNANFQQNSKSLEDKNGRKTFGSDAKSKITY